MIAALPELPTPVLETVLNAVRQEWEKRIAEARAGTSLADELDALMAALAERMDRVASEGNGRWGLWSPDEKFLLNLLVLLPGGVFPLTGVVGYRRTWPCEVRRYCSGQDAAACWPELLGVKPWDWPWQPLEPATHDVRSAYIRGFAISFAPLERAGLTLTVHFAARAIPHPCSRDYSKIYPSQRSIYVAVERAPEGYVARKISWAAYKKSCSQAAEILPDLRQAQEKSQRKRSLQSGTKISSRKEGRGR
jgi:hypothetical protein